MIRKLRNPLALPLAAILCLSGQRLPAHEWTLTLPSGSEGNFTAKNLGSGATVSGTTVRLPNGFVKQTVQSATGNNLVPTGAVRYGVEVPGLGFFSQPLVQDEGMATSALQTGTCPSATWEGVFAFSAWDKTSNNDLSQKGQPAFGVFAWDPKSQTASVAALYNLTDFAVLPGFKPFTTTGSCADGKITFSGNGDRAGVLHLTKNGGGLYFAATGKRMVVLPKRSLGKVAALEGTYSAIVFDNTVGTEPKVATLTLSGSKISGTGLGNVEKQTPDRDQRWEMTGLKTNHPTAGVLTAQLKVGDGKETGAACVVQQSGQTFLFCTAGSGEGNRRPLNFAMTLSAPVLAKNVR